MVTVDISAAIATLKREFEQRLTPSEIDKAISRALNHTAAKAKTAVKREISKKYKIRQKDISAALRLLKAYPNFLESKIEISGSPLPLIAFGARATQTGVSVNVMGDRKIIQRAFIQTVGNGHTGVFARGGYVSGGFNFRTKRVQKTGADLPITELVTLSIPTAASQNVIVKTLREKIEADFPIRLRHEFAHIARTANVSLPTD